MILKNQLYLDNQCEYYKSIWISWIKMHSFHIQPNFERKSYCKLYKKCKQNTQRSQKSRSLALEVHYMELFYADAICRGSSNVVFNVGEMHHQYNL